MASTRWRVLKDHPQALLSLVLALILALFPMFLQEARAGARSRFESEPTARFRLENCAETVQPAHWSMNIKLRRHWNGAAKWPGVFGVALVVLASEVAPGHAAAFDARGGQFISFKRFGGFERRRGGLEDRNRADLPRNRGSDPWDEMIASWNVDMPPGTYMKIEARALYLSARRMVHHGPVVTRSAAVPP